MQTSKLRWENISSAIWKASHHVQLSHRRMELTHSGPDEWRWVSDVLEALALDEIRHTIREVLIMGFHIVLQYQPTQGPRGFILVGGEKTDKWIVRQTGQRLLVTWCLITAQDLIAFVLIFIQLSTMWWMTTRTIYMKPKFPIFLNICGLLDLT